MKPKASDKICDKCKQNIYTASVRNYKETAGYNNALYDIATSMKTQFGPTVAEAIVESGKGLPPKVVELFEKVKETIGKKD